jgi:methionine synthase II (cobalamin-independent)
MATLKLQLSGTQRVVSKLKGMTLGGTGTLHVKVVYTAPYAIYVHEDLTKYHAPPTQAKFVEQPARQLRQEMRDMVAKKLKQKRALDLALLAAGQLLYDASQLLVPVDTGLLKASGRIEVV